MIQIAIATLLFFVLLFGIGFILNMLLKTTWFPIYLYVIVMVPFVVYWQWDGNLSFWGNVAAYTIVDYITAIGGLVGAVLSGMTIRYLRKSGYKMF